MGPSQILLCTDTLFKIGQRKKGDIVPVNQQRPNDGHQQNCVSPEGQRAAMKKEGKMRTNDGREPLSEVPVPGMRAIEVGHTVENVELQEVELHQGPLEKQE